MTKDQTDPRHDGQAAEPLALRLNDGLGPNVENKMTVMDNEDPADPSVHEPRVTGAPETIWLVYGELDCDDTHANCCASGEVTWCEDAQFVTDVRYLRADLLYHEARQIAGEALGPLRRLWPLFEKATNGYVFTAQRAGEVQADMEALRKALGA